MKKKEQVKKQGYDWKFCSIGGMTRVNITSGEDIAHLGELDQKLWTVLSCPTKGLEMEEATLKLMDKDGDGKIRVNEVVATAKYMTSVLKNSDDLLKQEDKIALEAFNQENPDGAKLFASSKQILANLGADGETISLAQASDQAAIFAATRFNGDGVITEATPETDALKAVVAAVAKTVGTVADRSGAAGVTADQIEAFYAACADYEAWQAAAEADKENIFPYGDATPAALAAVEAVKAKIDDYFVRCNLVTFDADANAALDVQVAKIGEIAASDLSAAAAEIATYPLARITGAAELPLDAINPAWQGAIAALKAAVLDPEAKTLSEAEWKAAQAKFDAYKAWNAAKKGAAAEALGLDAVKAFNASAEADKAALMELIAADKALEAESAAIDAVGEFLRLYRDFYQFLKNYVTMADFYQSYKEGAPKAVYQCGTLYIDQRALDLCVEVADMGKHAGISALSGMFILYCTCVSKVGGKTKNIAAVVTNGDIDTFRVGMNAVFYDRNGLDYDAVVTSIVDNPTSIRQAFWSPYRKMANTIQDRITKNATEKNNAVNANLTEKANTTTLSSGAEDAKNAKAPFDIAKFAGIFAALGMAVGLLGTMLAKLVKPWYMIFIVFFALIVIISGPSMFLAWLKLRKRNLGPLLNANGWAINSKIIVNVKFGATLTHLAKYPAIVADDPFAKKPMPKWKKALIWIAVIIVVLGGTFAGLYFKGKLAKFGLPFPKPVAEAVADAPDEAPVDDAATMELPAEEPAPVEE